ncbi:hypothetical protein, partial [Acinetobacter baumannii]|uniref:hypothetical protein n=1 Tax=Acinetobacter baumannii TaxID=470 RepID=UPI00209191F7
SKKLEVAGNGATTTINDTIDKVDVVLTATTTVGEGGNIVYTASLVDKKRRTGDQHHQPVDRYLGQRQDHHHRRKPVER